MSGGAATRNRTSGANARVCATAGRNSSCTVAVAVCTWLKPRNWNPEILNSRIVAATPAVQIQDPESHR